MTQAGSHHSANPRATPAADGGLTAKLRPNAFFLRAKGIFCRNGSPSRPNQPIRPVPDRLKRAPPQTPCLARHNNLQVPPATGWMAVFFFFSSFFFCTAPIVKPKTQKRAPSRRPEAASRGTTGFTMRATTAKVPLLGRQTTTPPTNVNLQYKMEDWSGSSKKKKKNTKRKQTKQTNTKQKISIGNMYVARPARV